MIISLAGQICPAPLIRAKCPKAHKFVINVCLLHKTKQYIIHCLVSIDNTHWLIVMQVVTQ